MGQATEKDYKDAVRLQKEKIWRAEAQLENNLVAAIKHNSINMLITKGGLRRISILYSILGEI